MYKLILRLASTVLAFARTPTHFPLDYPPLGYTNDIRTLDSSGTERTYILDTPPKSNINESSPNWPVIIAFHGRGRKSHQMRTLTNFHLAAPTAMVVHPQGLPGLARCRNKRNPEPTCWEGAPYAVPERNDVRFVEDILDSLIREFGDLVDQGRVYVSGKSNGAGFSAHLACKLSRRITAIAPVAGPFYDAIDLETPDPSCQPEVPVAVIDFHGTADLQVPYNGRKAEDCYPSNNRSGIIPSIPSWLDWWAEKDGCEDVVEWDGDREGNQSVTVKKWGSCRGGVEVEGWKIENGRHDWMSRHRNIDNSGEWGFVPAPLEVTEKIVEFFYRFRREKGRLMEL